MFGSEMLLMFVILIAIVMVCYLNKNKLKYISDNSNQNNELEELLHDNNYVKDEMHELYQKMGDNDDVDLHIGGNGNSSILSMEKIIDFPKNYLYNLLKNNLADKDKLLKITLDSYDLTDSKEIHRLNSISGYVNNPSFVIKSNNKTINSIYCANNDMSDTLRTINNNNKFFVRQFMDYVKKDDLDNLNNLKYHVVQKFIENQLLINEYTFKLKTYLLITKQNGENKSYVYKNGLIYYANQKYNSDNINSFNAFASRKYMNRNRTENDVKKIYENMPHTLLQWKEQLSNNNEPVDVILNNVLNVNKIVATAQTPNVKDNSFAIYEIDMIFDNNYSCYVLKMNSFQKLNCKTDLEKRVRRNVLNDSLEITNLIQNKDGKNGMREIF